MKVYIELEQAVKHLRTKVVSKYPSSFLNGILASALELYKVQDVIEVKHGYWKRGQWIDDYNAGGYYLSECSLCGCTQKKASNFCSDCGADMRGETKKEEI